MTITWLAPQGCHLPVRKYHTRIWRVCVQVLGHQCTCLALSCALLQPKTSANTLSRLSQYSSIDQRPWSTLMCFVQSGRMFWYFGLSCQTNTLRVIMQLSRWLQKCCARLQQLCGMPAQSHTESTWNADVVKQIHKITRQTLEKVKTSLGRKSSMCFDVVYVHG